MAVWARNSNDINYQETSNKRKEELDATARGIPAEMGIGAAAILLELAAQNPMVGGLPCDGLIRCLSTAGYGLALKYEEADALMEAKAPRLSAKGQKNKNA